MEFTKTSPIVYNIDVAPGSNLTCEFKINGSKRPVKLNVELHIYFKHQIRPNMIDVISSDVYTVKTSKNSTTHKINIEVPEFRDRIRSFIIIQMDKSADLYEKLFLDYINVNVDKYPKISERIQLDQIHPQQEQRPQIRKDFVQQFQLPTRSERSEFQQNRDQFLTGSQTKNRAEYQSRQSTADQLRASTIIPNAQPKIFPSAPVDVFSQLVPRSDSKRNIEIQDIQALRSIEKDEHIKLNTISKIVGVGRNIIGDPKIAIASIIRDEESNGNLKRFLDCCLELENYHNNIVYTFIEGDSSDGTYDILKNWVNSRSGSILQKIEMGYPKFPKNRDNLRTIYFAQLRNVLIESILAIPSIDDIFMIDANYEWKGDIIEQLKNVNSDIVAPLTISHKDSKGKYVFYDIWAFRKNGTEFWPFYPYTEDMKFDEPLDVDSVGGGYLIKRKVLEMGTRYNGNNNSEQIGFCTEAKKLGFDIKIDPRIFITKIESVENKDI